MAKASSQSSVSTDNRVTTITDSGNTSAYRVNNLSDLGNIQIGAATNDPTDALPGLNSTLLPLGLVLVVGFVALAFKK